MLLCRYPCAVGGHLVSFQSLAVINDVPKDIMVLVFWWDMCVCLPGSYLGGKLLCHREYVDIASMDPDTSFFKEFQLLHIFADTIICLLLFL